MIRVRQVAVVASDREAVIAELSGFPAVSVCFADDPGIVEFGLHNAIMTRRPAIRRSPTRPTWQFGVVLGYGSWARWRWGYPPVGCAHPLWKASPERGARSDREAD